MRYRDSHPPHTRATLEATRGLLLPDGVWIKGHHCTTKQGRTVGYWDERAYHFSLEGALLRVGYITRQPVGEVYSYLLRAISPSKVTTVANWNDAQQTTHSTVIELLNRCIMQLGGQRHDLFPPEGE